MGSLKDEMKGLRDDCQPCEKTDNGEHPGSPDDISTPEEPQENTSDESTNQEHNQTELQMNTCSVEEGAGDQAAKDSAILAAVCGNTDNPDSETEKNTSPVKQQEKADKTSTINSSDVNNDVTIATQSMPDEPRADLSPQRNAEIPSEKSVDQEVRMDAGCGNMSVLVPSTPGPSTPAPFGQHHMRTQVSLEVVQCQSAATSPMTPPEGGQSSFFFPHSFGRPGAVGVETRDAELQVERQVEFCSVATSPMTPKTPYSTAFAEMVGNEVQMEEKAKTSVQQSPTEIEADVVPGLEFTTPVGGSTESPEKSDRTADSQKDRNQQCKQERMGSMDQDITILVTHHDNFEREEEEEEEEGENAESAVYPVKPEMVKIDEKDEDKGDDAMEKSSETNNNGKNSESDASNANQQIPGEEASLPASKHPKTEDSTQSQVKENKGVSFSEHICQSDDSVKKCNLPESPAPFGFHNIRTQVSLEVVQCQSAATSPMTPPEGDQAFYFPSVSGRQSAATETKDAELQVGRQVEFRNVATAPMTPRTPTATCFPEIRKEENVDEKTAKDVEKVETSEDKKLAEEQTAREKEEDEKSEEPVQEVSWDEKGMTWEVYGAVVEVAVLGSAIQKHLEKQVKKRELAAPPLSPLSPSATPLPSDSAQGDTGKGRSGKRGERDGKVARRRRNPFRLLLQNMQQPHCCSRAHTAD